MKTAFFVSVALLLAGCAVPYPYYETGAYQYQQPMPPPVQYAPQQVAPVGCIPPYYPVWNGCALPMYRPPQYYGGMYTYPLFEPGLWFQFNFGGKHHRGYHRGGGHHRR